MCVNYSSAYLSFYFLNPIPYISLSFSPCLPVSFSLSSRFLLSLLSPFLPAFPFIHLYGSRPNPLIILSLSFLFYLLRNLTLSVSLSLSFSLLLSLSLSFPLAHFLSLALFLPLSLLLSLSFSL